MDWNEIDQRLARMAKDRLWLSTVTRYSDASVREALAPNSKKRSTRMLSVLSRAIEDEEQRQAPVKSREVRPGVFEIFQSDEQLHTADRASRIVGAPSLADYCRDVILAESARILREEADDQTGSSGAPNPVSPVTPDNIDPFPDAGPVSDGSSSPGGSSAAGA